MNNICKDTNYNVEGTEILSEWLGIDYNWKCCTEAYYEKFCMSDLKALKFGEKSCIQDFSV